MKKENLISNENHAHIFQNPEIASAMKEIVTYREFPKKHILFKEGDVCDCFYVIISGITRMFYLKEGVDITVHFSTKNEGVGVYESFVKQNKSKFNIETQTDVKLYEISYQKFNDLLNTNSDVERYYRFFIQQLHINLIDRVNESYFSNAKERYEKLLIQKPELFQKIPLKHLATYLNITPETLSRIRKK